MTKTPKPWVAALLGLFGGPLGLLYAGRPLASLLYGLALAMLAILAVAWSVLLSPWVSLASVLMTIAGAFQAWRAAKRWPTGRARPWYSRWFGLLIVAGVFVSVAVGVRAFMYEPFRVASGSMLPTLTPGTSVFVGKWGYGHYNAYGISLSRRAPSEDLVRGDLMVFNPPRPAEGAFIGRLIGLPGDVVVYEDRRLQINGHALVYEEQPPYLENDSMRFLGRKSERFGDRAHDILIDEQRPALPPSDTFPFCAFEALERLTCPVPEGHVFMMGDNRDNSLDSRYFGPVPVESIVGKVVRVGAPHSAP